LPPQQQQQQQHQQAQNQWHSTTPTRHPQPPQQQQQQQQQQQHNNQQSQQQAVQQQTVQQANLDLHRRHEELAETIRQLSETHQQLLNEDIELTEQMETIETEFADELHQHDVLYEREKRQIEEELRDRREAITEAINAEFRIQLEARKREIEHVIFPESYDMMEEDVLGYWTRLLENEWNKHESKARKEFRHTVVETRKTLHATYNKVVQDAVAPYEKQLEEAQAEVNMYSICWSYRYMCYYGLGLRVYRRRRARNASADPFSQW
jgi:vacuolar-type H+-ATPase subunit I/STV1